MKNDHGCRSSRHGHHRWRAIPDRHVPWHWPACPALEDEGDGCPGCADHPPGCSGCEPCPERHCTVCGWRHLARLVVCVRCVANTREDLALIGRHLVTAPELIDGWPSTTQLEPYSGSGERRDTVLVGDLGVMLLDGSAGRSEDGTTWRGDDPMPVRWLLESWADDWHDRFGGRRTHFRSGLPMASEDYLTSRIDRAVVEHPAFADFAAELHAVRVELDHRAGAADRERTEVPCPYCGDKLIRPDADPDACPEVWVPPLDTLGYGLTLEYGIVPGFWRPCEHEGHGHDQGGLRDHWQCRNRDCKRMYPVERYRLAIWQAWHERRKRDSEPSEVPTPTGSTP